MACLIIWTPYNPNPFGKYCSLCNEFSPTQTCRMLLVQKYLWTILHFPSLCAIFPVPLAATHPQSIKVHAMLLPFLTKKLIGECGPSPFLLNLSTLVSRMYLPYLDIVLHTPDVCFCDEVAGKGPF